MSKLGAILQLVSAPLNREYMTKTQDKECLLTALADVLCSSSPISGSKIERIKKCFRIGCHMGTNCHSFVI